MTHRNATLPVDAALPACLGRRAPRAGRDYTHRDDPDKIGAVDWRMTRSWRCLLVLSWSASLFAPRSEAAEFRVDSAVDAIDFLPGDGQCAAFVIDAGQLFVRCTLRAAIMEANHWPGRDTVRLEAHTYALSLGGRSEDESRTGDLDITESVAIRAATPATINALYRDRVVDVHPAAETVLENIAIVNGSLTGGDGDGAGIRARRASLSLRKVLVMGNVADGTAECGGIDFNDWANDHVAGIARFDMRDSLVMLNRSGRDGGGACISLSAGSALILASRVNGNWAEGTGGGLRLRGGTRLKDDSSIQIGLERTVIYNNYSRSAVAGLAMWAGEKHVVVRDSAIVGNQSDGVGRTVAGWLIDARYADVTNVTISGNRSLEAASGLWMLAGPLSRDTPGVNLNNVTITDNVVRGQCADEKTGEHCAAVVYATAAPVPGVGVQNSIISGNEGPVPFRDIQCSSRVQSRGYNIVGVQVGCGFWAGGLDALDVRDPELGPLGSHVSVYPLRCETRAARGRQRCTRRGWIDGEVRLGGDGPRAPVSRG